MEYAQPVLTTLSIMATMDVDVHQEKFLKEQHVSVNASLMSWLMQMEIAILVEIIRLSPTDSVSVLLDMPLIVVESAFFPALVMPSTSKVVVLSVP